jgi:phospholipase A-2-activating protein
MSRIDYICCVHLVSHLLSSLENPYSAAQRFLQKNELPSSYLDEVVNFIHKSTEGVKLGEQDNSSNAYSDPFTGSSRYTGASNSSGPSQGGGDPYTSRFADSLRTACSIDHQKRGQD